MAKFYIIDWKGNIVRETTMKEIVTSLKHSVGNTKIDWNDVLSDCQEFDKYMEEVFENTFNIKN